MKLFIVLFTCFFVTSGNPTPNSILDKALYSSEELSDICTQRTGVAIDQIQYLQNSETTKVDGNGACYAYCVLSEQRRLLPKMTFPLEKSNLRNYDGDYSITLDVDNMLAVVHYMKKCKEYISTL